MLTEKQKQRAIVGFALTWIVLALAIDRYVLSDYAPWLSNMLYFRDAEIVVQPFSRKFVWLGLTLLLIVPSFVIGVVLSIYLLIKKKIKFADSFMVFGATAFWFLLIPLFIWIGDNIYRFLKGLLDDWAWAKGLASFLEGFTFKGDMYIYGFKFWSIDSGLGALVGLAVGILLLYKKGLWETIKNAARV